MNTWSLKIPFLVLSIGRTWTPWHPNSAKYKDVILSGPGTRATNSREN